MTLQLSWRERYVFADGYTFRHHPDRLLLTRARTLLPVGRARSVLARLAHEAPELLERLRVALGVPALAGGRAELARELSKRLGPPSSEVSALPGPFAQLLVFERELPGAPSPVAKPKPPAPRSLAEAAASVVLLLVDEWGNPLSGPSYSLTTPDGSSRAGAFDSSGTARQEGVQPGPCELDLPELHAGEVRLRSAPPDGWLRDEIGISIRDACGVPLGALKVEVLFDDGATRTASLDAAGSCRLTGVPSRPLRVRVASFDPEAWT